MNEPTTLGREAETALERWLAVESRLDDEAADEAFAALFAFAEPAPAVPGALSARLAAVADAAAAERTARSRAFFGLHRQAVQRLAALLLVAAGLAAAGVQWLYSETAAATGLGELTPARAISSLAEGFFSVFSSLGDAFGAVAGYFETLLQLSGAVATVAGTAPVAAALGLALVLAAVAFRILRELLARERGWTHVQRH